MGKATSHEYVGAHRLSKVTSTTRRKIFGRQVLSQRFSHFGCDILDMMPASDIKAPSYSQFNQAVYIPTLPSNEWGEY